MNNSRLLSGMQPVRAGFGPPETCTVEPARGDIGRRRKRDEADCIDNLAFLDSGPSLIDQGRTRAINAAKLGVGVTTPPSGRIAAAIMDDVNETPEVVFDQIPAMRKRRQ